MPLTILVPLVVVGLVLVFLAVKFWGGSGIERPLDENTARERIGTDFPGFEINEIFVCDDAKTAFLTSANSNQIALIHAVGQNHLTRILDPTSIRSLDEQGEDIIILMNDFTLKSVRARFNNAESRTMVKNKLEALLK